jgi:hypothetical protein
MIRTVKWGVRLPAGRQGLRNAESQKMDRGDSRIWDFGMLLSVGPELSMVQCRRGVRNTPKKKDYYLFLAPPPF